MGNLVPGISQCLTRAQNSRGQLSGPVSPAREPLLGAWLGLELVSWAFSSPPSRVSITWAASQAGETWGLMCSLSLLPCPSLSSGMGTQPALVIVCCGACLQPLSSPAPPLACKVCFLIAAPTTHLGSARSPSSSSLPPSSGVGLKGKANLTAALLS